MADGTATPAALARVALTPAPTAVRGGATSSPAAIAWSALTPDPIAAAPATPAEITLTVDVPRPHLGIDAALSATWGPMTATMTAGTSTPVSAVLAATWGGLDADMVTIVGNRIEAVLAASW